MRDDFNVEDALRRYRAKPSARVKQSVLAHFNGFRDPGTTRRSELKLWKRPVPLYLAATALLILVGLSFAAGRSSSRSTGENSLATSPNIEWVASENDIL